MSASSPALTSAAITTRLRAAGCVFAEDEATVLLADATTSAELESRVARRVAGEPLEYIVGWAEFCGLHVSVAPGVFVPRQRTTLLVRESLRVAPRRPVVLDLCCGAGAIGAAILAARPDASVYAADIDPAATDCARRTLAAVRDSPRWSSSAAEVDAYRDPPPSRTLPQVPPQVFTGDLYSPLPVSLKGTVDILAVNAPYVPTDEIAFMPSEARDHEARAALDGGADGLALHRRVADGAREWLAPGGHLLIETSERQASASAGILESAGLSVSIVHDDEVDGTAVIGRLAPAR
ncbi:MAG TPA: methyltransferase [Humibacter sp.]|nr:methyltransferase [Humibacter sp.]